MKTRVPAVLLLLLCAAAVAAQNAAMHVERDVAVPMRDGVVLRADVFRPAATGKFPTLVYRTPYGKHEAPEDYTTFRRAVERGYAVVVQDVRGRYKSDGEYRPYENEGRDGHDTIEWAARQPWSDGNVGTFGLSYPGAVQWLAAMERPPHLKAMVPAMTFATPRNFFYSGGVFDLSWPAWIWNNIAPDLRVKKNLPGPRTGEEARAEWKKIRDRVRSHLPLAGMAELKPVAPFYYDWLRYGPNDKFWDFAELRGRYDRAVDVAVLNLSGWHDEAYGPDGATTNFNGLVAVRGGPKKTAVLIGPWTHGVDATGHTKAGEREFGPAARIDYDEVVLRWMDRWLRGVDNGVDRETPVRTYVMGADRWRQSDVWPLKSVTPATLYLAPSPGMAGRSKDGRLLRDAPTLADSYTEWVSDPAKPVSDPHPDPWGAMDYRSLAERDDVLVFDTPPLESDTEVTGPIQAHMYISVDAPDTDLWVRLLDVAPDGAAFNLMSPGLDVVRASERNGRHQPLQPGEVYKLSFPNLVTSNLFRKGHRIRVQVSTAFFPHFSRNLHTGKSEAISAEMRKARVRLWHAPGRLSHVVLPLVPAADSAEAGPTPAQNIR